MPLQPHMKLISVDDHIIEPPDLWTSRLPTAHLDAGPRVIEVDGAVTTEIGAAATAAGTQMWTFEGQPFPNIALNAVAGKSHEEFGLEPVRFDQIRPGCYDPAERVKDMDIDGVQAQLGFPTFPGFAGRVFATAKDKELALLCVRAYNDFILDEWCGPHPDRLIPMVILPLWDAELAAAELRRTAERGAKAVAFPENPAGLDLPSFHSGGWDPLLAVAEEAGTPLCMHFGTSTRMPFVAADAPFPVTIALMGTNSINTLSELLFSPIFHAFPRLKVTLAEGGVGWIPWFLERIDLTWERHRFYNDVNKEVRPSALFRRNVWGCFIDDTPGLLLRDVIGVDRITWEGDYPHSDSSWPHSRKRAGEAFVDVPDADVHRIVELNARELLSFDADLHG
ncbi:amidohydrolase [Frankia sp. AiPs1]|uniref:amidohydrolase family protein n=1 Tax=Frankia sp. AiPs1 TaxID=573493 RepID=UPI0020437817|nr:amidohydrolase family protein [Frankia sp. AiPs1]MCM3921800.1 amidohydrolase [Frankia sp. AiPs1]